MLTTQAEEVLHTSGILATVVLGMAMALLGRPSIDAALQRPLDIIR